MVEHDGPDSNQGAVLDHGTMNDCPVPDGHPLPDDARHALIAMQHRPILNIALVTDFNAVGVTPKDGGRPHARARAEGDLAEDDGSWVDKGGGIDHVRWVSEG